MYDIDLQKDREALAKDANYSKHIASSECEVAIGNIREYIP